MDKKKEFLQTLSSLFLEKGFKKKGNTLTFDEKKSVIIVNFQKSSFADIYYLNFGLFFKTKTSSVKSEDLKIQDAHFFGRYEEILGIKGNVADISKINEVSTACAEIFATIEKDVLPYFEKLKSLSYLKTILPKNVPWGKIWLQNIKGEDLLRTLESDSFLNEG